MGVGVGDEELELEPQEISPQLSTRMAKAETERSNVVFIDGDLSARGVGILDS